MIGSYRTPPANADVKKMYLRGNRGKALVIGGLSVEQALALAAPIRKAHTSTRKPVAVTPPGHIPQKAPKKKLKPPVAKDRNAGQQCRVIRFDDPGPLPPRPTKRTVLAPGEFMRPERQQQPKPPVPKKAETKAPKKLKKRITENRGKKRLKKNRVPDLYERQQRFEGGHRIVQGGLPELGRRR